MPRPEKAKKRREGGAQPVIEKQASGPQPRRAVFWEAQHTSQYVSIPKSRATQDQGLRRRFSATG
jgi:hypothetical protein